MTDLLDRIINRIATTLFVLCLGLVLLLVVFVIIAAIQYLVAAHDLHCTKWEDKVIYQEEFTEYRLVGKVIVPVQHPSGYYVRNVCTAT